MRTIANGDTSALQNRPGTSAFTRSRSWARFGLWPHGFAWRLPRRNRRGYFPGRAVFPARTQGPALQSSYRRDLQRQSPVPASLQGPIMIGTALWMIVPEPVFMVPAAGRGWSICSQEPPYVL